MTQKWFNRIMEVYQKMKLLGQDVSIGDAYRKVFPEIVESVANQAGRMPAFPGK